MKTMKTIDNSMLLVVALLLCCLAWPSSAKLSDSLLGAVDKLQLQHTDQFQSIRAKLSDKYGLDKESIGKCYDYRIGEQKGDMFNESLTNVVKKLLAEHGDGYLHLNSKKDVVNHAKNIRDNLQELAGLILECLENGYSEDGLKFGLTPQAALSQDQYERLMGTKVPDLNSSNVCAIPKVSSIPAEFDLRSYNLVTRVKDQGFCGSCYIFAATAAMETQVIKKMNNIEGVPTEPVEATDFELSEQAELDCNVNGCDGGMPGQVYADFQVYGAQSSKGYQYTGVPHRAKCNKTHSQIYVPTAYCQQQALLPDTAVSDEDLKKLILAHGSVAVGVNARKFQYIMGTGRWPKKWPCLPMITHAVTLVGWTADGFWIIKNSWGPWWGDKGYLYVPMGGDKCGINTLVAVVYV